MDYVLIFRSAYDSCAMEKVYYDGMGKYILWQMLDMRSGCTICKTLQVSFEIGRSLLACDLH